MKKDSPQPDFSSFSFTSAILSAIESAGYKYATDVQLQAIPPALEGRDVLARAETGSGKTAAYVLPLLEKLNDQGIYQHKDRDERYSGSERAKSNRTQIVVLVPTRELATQVRNVFVQLAKNIQPPVECVSIFGGVKINPQMMTLRGGADVVVATPGRLLDLFDQNAIKFNQVKTLVIDEVDRLMKGDFEAEISRILNLLPRKRQNMMFTATFPESIRTLVREVMNDPVIINVDDVPEEMPIDQHVVTVNHDKKNDLLAHLLNENDWKQVLIFCSAKRTCNNLVVKLEKRGIDAVAMHGDKEQSARATALRNFKSGETRILIATDVAARGLDIEQLPCVINYDLPRSPNDYTHRIGRTGRAGQAGQAITLIAHHEYQHWSVIVKRNFLELETEQVVGFEADEIAPPPPEKTHPKKLKVTKNKKKINKKQKKRLADQAESSEETTNDVSSVQKSYSKPRVEQIASEAISKNTPNEKVSNDTDDNVNSDVEKTAGSQKLDEKVSEEKTSVNAHIWGNRKT